jgi:hypothetical protein
VTRAALDAGSEARAQAPRAEPEPSGSTVASAAPPSVAAGDPSPGCPGEDAGGCPSYARGFARARRLAAAGDLACAIRAWDEALRDRPLDPVARAERGYPRMRAGEDPTTDLEIALGVAKEPGLRAQIWFNLGLYAERADAERARVAFAVAERLGSTAATGKLGARSRCTATWTTRPEADFPVLEGKPAAELRSRCSEGGPCTLETGSLHVHLFREYVEPMDGGRCYHEPMIDTDTPSPHGIDGDFLWVDIGGTTDRSIDGEFAGAPEGVQVDAQGAWSDRPVTDPDAAGACRPDLDAGVALGVVVCAQCFQPAVRAPSPRHRFYFQLSARRPVLELDVTDGDVTATFAGGVATITGAGCEARMPVGGAGDAGGTR